MSNYVKNFLNYKDLLIELIKTDIKIKYKNSVLGIIWSMLNPLLMMIVLLIVFSALFKNNIENYAVYLLSGRILYSFFSDSTNFAMNSVVGNAGLIKKVYIPKYIFPLSKVCSSFIVFLISMTPLILVMVLTGVDFTYHMIFVLLPLAYIFLISLGIGLILSVINVFFGDIKHLYSIVLLVLMYMTPIFYPPEIIPNKYLSVIEIVNPLFIVVKLFREALYGNMFSSLLDHFHAIIYCIIYVGIGLYVFYKKQDKFIFYV